MSMGTPSKSPFGPGLSTKFAEEDDDDHLASFRFSPSPRSPRPGGSQRFSLGSAVPLPSLNHMSSIGDLTGDGTVDGEDEDEKEDEHVTWTVLVAGMRLLWTLDIRDAVFIVVGDLLHTIEMMKLLKKFQKRDTRARNNTLEGLGRGSTAEMIDVGDGFLLPLAARGFLENNGGDGFDSSEDDDEDEVPSSLMHLLLDRKESTASSVGFADTDAARPR